MTSFEDWLARVLANDKVPNLVNAVRSALPTIARHRLTGASYFEGRARSALPLVAARRAGLLSNFHTSRR
jgi:hypothetical protein